MAQIKSKQIIYQKNSDLEEYGFKHQRAGSINHERIKDIDSPLNFQELQPINFNNAANHIQRQNDPNKDYSQPQTSQQRQWTKLPVKKQSASSNQKSLPALSSSKSASDMNFGRIQNIGLVNQNVASILKTNNSNNSSQSFRMQLRKKFEEEKVKKNSQQMATLSNELLKQYFDTTNSHITRIPEFPSRFTAAPFIRYGPQQIQAQAKKQILTQRIQNSSEISQLNQAHSKSLLEQQSHSKFLNTTKSLAQLSKAPPDFRDHKAKSSTEYFLPKIKDGLPTTVKNLTFLRNQHSPKKIKEDEEQKDFKHKLNQMSMIKSMNSSNLNDSQIQTLQIVSESPFRKRKANLQNFTNKDLGLTFFQTELLVAEASTPRQNLPQQQESRSIMMMNVVNQSKSSLLEEEDKPFLTMNRLNSIGHKFPVEVKDMKGYESARKHEKKMSMSHYRQELLRQSLNKSQSASNITKQEDNSKEAIQENQIMLINDGIINENLQMTLFRDSLYQTQNVFKNSQILDKNNKKTKNDLINSIRRFDDRTISYDKAKSKLWDLTKNYLYQHFQKNGNSRETIFPQYNKRGDLVNRDSLIDISFRSVFSKQFQY